MLYFIHSPKQTSYCGMDTYWMANENGYTRMLADAGVYTEKDKERISARSSEWGATFIPVTKELLQKAEEQLRTKQNSLNEYESQEIQRHTEELASIEKRRKENDLRKDKLYDIKELLRLELDEKELN